MTSTATPGELLDPADTLDASLAHLRARLEALEGRVATVIAQRRARRPLADDRFRGAFLSDAQIDALLADPGGATEGGHDPAAAVEAAVDGAEADGSVTRLRRLQRVFALDAVAVDLLLVALAPDLDPRFELLYAYLHDDLTRRRVSVGLALELAGRDPLDAAARAALDPAGALVATGLLEIDGADGPALGRTLRVPDRVTAHLIGHEVVDRVVEPLLVPSVPLPGPVADRAAAALRSGTSVFYVREAAGTSGPSVAAAALADVGLRTLALDLAAGRTAASGSAVALVPAVVREAGLTGSGLVVEKADRLAVDDPAALRRLVESPTSVFLCGARTWDPDWARSVPFSLEAPVTTEAERAELVRATLGDATAVGEADVAAVARLRMRPLQIVRTVHAAQREAAAEGRPLGLADLEAAARQLNSVSLDALSTRITPAATWEQLVLPTTVANSVRSVVNRARHKELVQRRWGFGVGTRRLGTLALFGGPPGTGKTLAAEVIAGELGVDLYVVNLATVVDKYIGETEKNLDRIFDAAADVNGLLFFDEADALFGKRSEVKDARDRYANVEVAYLLQRLERFDGIAVLATNLSANLDEAFARRIDVTAQFRLPEPAERRTIWQISLAPDAPVDPDLDLDFMASSFELSGGSIRNICVTAAYLAADTGGPIAMRHLVRAAAQEHRKLGRLVVESEFGRHFSHTAEVTA
ncbi:ATP-binding protein [Jatrophihabitans fulvus]